MAGKDKNDSIPNWHPDFRIQATLPDVKVVRTGFLVNFVALTVPVLLLGFILFREWNLMGYKNQIEAQQKTIQDESASNNNHLKNSRNFAKDAKKIDDLGAFYKGQIDVLEVIVALAESRPKNIALSRISFSKREVAINKKKKKTVPMFQLEGVLQGSSTEALDTLNNYKEILGALSVFEGKINPINSPQPVRNPVLDLFEFSLSISMKTPDK